MYMKPLHFVLAHFLLLSACTAYPQVIAAIIPPTSTPTIRPTRTPKPSPTYFHNPTDVTEASLATASAIPPAPTTTVQSLPYPGAECIPDNPRVPAEVLQVLDVGTIDVEIEGRRVTVRYIGIDTPDISDPESSIRLVGEESTEKNRRMVENRPVTLVNGLVTSDGYGRLLSYVLIDDLFINFELIRQGYATQYISRGNDSCARTFEHAELVARNAGFGLWGE